ncbi:hypothetical protein PoB_006070500 [Plakobranchus ocellatus]|uniref:Uncharacterized protein n=1 Tax=Plakobranchus ocellatus TaxID=259542 RepID=A0AAV4CQL7_9GAST|nr:hypothetical protein PoB_006070500 [Plakobranchus ocellatus]
MCPPSKLTQTEVSGLRGIDGTVDCKPVLRSVGTLLSRFRAWPGEGPQSLRSPCSMQNSKSLSTNGSFSAFTKVSELLAAKLTTAICIRHLYDRC